MTEEEAKEKGYEVGKIPDILADENHPFHEDVKEILEKLKTGEISLS